MSDLATGVYVHFPWCLKKCPYCDFVSFAAKRENIDSESYADAVLRELERRAEALDGRRIESVFFGGGTPSLWKPAALGRVLRAILTTSHAPDLEVTVECNPTSLDEDRARALVDQGVNRLSIGVQGLNAERLRFLGRLHDPAGGLEAVEAAVRAKVPRVSADLIYGVGGKTSAEGKPPRADEEAPSEAADEARRLVETGITHLSAYCLTIEASTAFGELAQRGRLPLASEDGVTDAFFAIERAVEGAGLAHYEVSNYARPGHESRHNLGYWQGRDYLGLGCAAYGTLSDARSSSATRYHNAIEPNAYMAATRGARALVVSEEPLDAETRLRERIMLGLRLRDGFDLEDAARALHLDPWPDERRRAAQRLVASGRLLVEGGRLRIPHDAWVFADGVAAELF
jgi:oxygen-independent coproporphyrinogen-3 oxidase